MSISFDQFTPQTEWSRTEDARFRSIAAITDLIMPVTLRELARRCGTLTLATLLSLIFYLVCLETHWAVTRLLSISLGWVAATLALFTQVSPRPADRCLAVSGAQPASLLLGRYLAALGLGQVLGPLYSGLVLIAIGKELTHSGTIPVMLLLTATVAIPLGSLTAALVPWDLKDALLLLSIMAAQVLMDPSRGWTRVPPLWSTREFAGVVVENPGSEIADYLRRGLVHGATMTVLLTAASWAIGVLRLHTMWIPVPIHGQVEN